MISFSLASSSIYSDQLGFVKPPDHFPLHSKPLDCLELILAIKCILAGKSVLTNWVNCCNWWVVALIVACYICWMWWFVGGKLPWFCRGGIGDVSGLVMWGGRRKSGVGVVLTRFDPGFIKPGWAFVVGPRKQKSGLKFDVWFIIVSRVHLV